jgi:hypothetical protein
MREPEEKREGGEKWRKREIERERGKKHSQTPSKPVVGFAESACQVS